MVGVEYANNHGFAMQGLTFDFLSNLVFLSVGRVGSSADLIAQKVEFFEDFD